MRDDELELLAQQADQQFTRRRRTMEHFRYDEQQERYWDITTGTLLGAKSVDGAIPQDEWPTREDQRNGELRPFAPSRAINNIDTGLTVEGATWWPGLPQFIEDTVVTERGAMNLRGAQTYNSYVPPDRNAWRTDQNADRWVEHVKFLFPDPVEYEHFFDFAAHMVQKPDEKMNHGLVMAGPQGIGKDTALLPLRYAVGHWNAAEIGPDDVTSAYNGYVRSVLLIINEVRPHDEDFKASNFYNMLKPVLASPPEMLAMNLKYANTIYVRNLCHVVLTTNDPLTMYIPAEDRRLFVMTSPLPDPKELPVFGRAYFDEMYHYLRDGGMCAVARWLFNRKIRELNPGMPPPMTAGKQAIIDSSHQVRRTVIDDVFETILERFFGSEKPVVIFHRDLSQCVAESGLFDDHHAVVKALNAKNFHFKMAERGYDMVRNPDAAQWANGKWKTRMAFILKSVPRSRQVETIMNELQRRPLEFRRVE